VGHVTAFSRRLVYIVPMVEIFKEIETKKGVPVGLPSPFKALSSLANLEKDLRIRGMLERLSLSPSVLTLNPGDLVSHALSQTVEKSEAHRLMARLIIRAFGGHTWKILQRCINDYSYTLEAKDIGRYEISDHLRLDKFLSDLRSTHRVLKSGVDPGVAIRELESNIPVTLLRPVSTPNPPSGLDQVDSGTYSGREVGQGYFGGDSGVASDLEYSRPTEYSVLHELEGPNSSLESSPSASGEAATAPDIDVVDYAIPPTGADLAPQGNIKPAIKHRKVSTKQRLQSFRAKIGEKFRSGKRTIKFKALPLRKGLGQLIGI
jgi:hypothetical protein